MGGGGTGQHAGCYTGGLGPAQHAGNRDSCRIVQVGRSDQNTAVCLLAGTDMQIGHRLVIVVQQGGLRIAFQLLGTLVALVHFKYMIGRGQHHLAAFGQDHGLQHVDHLGNVGHADGITVVVEDIQVDGRHQRIAHGVLLVKEAGVRVRFHIVPGAPFIHGQAHFAVALILLDNAGVVLHQLFHLQGLVQGGIVFLIGKVCGRALVLPILMGHGIVMQ